MLGYFASKVVLSYLGNYVTEMQCTDNQDVVIRDHLFDSKSPAVKV